MALDKIVIMDGEIHRTEKTYINDIEYIRKDALLEWAKSSIITKHDSPEIMAGYNSALQGLIDKINSM